MRDKTWSTTTKVDRSLPMTVWHLHGNFSLQNIILAWYSYWLYGIVVRISSTRVQANYWSVSLLMMLYSVTNCTWPDSLRRVICKHTYHENDRCICDGFYAKRGHDVIITTWLYIIFFSNYVHHIYQWFINKCFYRFNWLFYFLHHFDNNF